MNRVVVFGLGVSVALTVACGQSGAPTSRVKVSDCSPTITSVRPNLVNTNRPGGRFLISGTNFEGAAVTSDPPIGLARVTSVNQDATEIRQRFRVLDRDATGSFRLRVTTNCPPAATVELDLVKREAREAPRQPVVLDQSHRPTSHNSDTLVPETDLTQTFTVGITESYRLRRRASSLRGLAHGKTEEVFP